MNGERSSNLLSYEISHKGSPTNQKKSENQMYDEGIANAENFKDFTRDELWQEFTNDVKGHLRAEIKKKKKVERQLMWSWLHRLVGVKCEPRDTFDVASSQTVLVDEDNELFNITPAVREPAVTDPPPSLIFSRSTARSMRVVTCLVSSLSLLWIYDTRKCTTMVHLPIPSIVRLCGLRSTTSGLATGSIP